MDLVQHFNGRLSETLLTAILKTGMTQLRGLGATLEIQREGKSWDVKYRQPKTGPQLVPEEVLIMAASVIWGPEHDELMTNVIGEYLTDEHVQMLFEELAQQPPCSPEQFRLLAYRAAIHYIRRHGTLTPDTPLLGNGS
jgi:hypothetical protein